MATYTFETITAAEALAFGATDTLVVSDPAAKATSFRVSYVSDPGTATTPPSTLVVLTNNDTGVSKTFSTNLMTEKVNLASSNSQVVVGSDAADTGGTALVFTGSPAYGAIFGGAGGDSLTGSAGGDWLQGNQGIDSIASGGGNDTVFGGADDDLLTVTGAGVNLINGNKGEDTLDASAATGGSTLRGGADNDVILAGSGNDVIFGDLGDDSIDNTANGDGSITGGDGDDTILGGTGADVIQGSAGDDSIVGGGGNDVLRGGGGNDQITLSYAAATNTGTAFGDNGNDLISVTGAHTAAITVNSNADNDTITSNDVGGASFLGGAGDDTIGSSGGGAKYIAGNLGDDTIDVSGVDANDTILGGDGDDLVTFNAGAGGSSHSFDLGAGIDNLTVTRTGSGVGDGNDTILGGDGNDTILVSGSATYDGDERIDGGAGDDLITAGDGDTGGNDTLIGGLGADTITAAAKTNGGIASIDGGAGSDLLTGGAGNDVVLGGDGDDTITGGAGEDALSGGAGADRFIFANASSANTVGDQDQISDWSSSDKLDFGALTGTYVETVATDYAAATTYAAGQFGANNFVAVQVGSDVVVFADTTDNSALDAGDVAVVLVGRSLADIDSTNLV